MSLRFPATRICSFAEFESWAQNMRTTFDQRWLYEQKQIESGLSASRAGTCALCLAPTIFHSDAPPEGRNWREEMNCDCPKNLNNRQRALLHFLSARVGVAAGQTIALVGRESAIEPPLCDSGMRVIRLSRLVNGRLAMADHAVELLICDDYLQYVPLAPVLLHELSRVVQPRGRLLLSVPFDVGSAVTRSRLVDLPRIAADTSEPLHLFGWDLLDTLRGLGFADVAAHFYWSDEFGYLGPFNMIISGERLP